MAIGTLGRKIIFEVSDDYMFTFKDMTREITSRWANHLSLIHISEPTRRS